MTRVKVRKLSRLVLTSRRTTRRRCVDSRPQFIDLFHCESVVVDGVVTETELTASGDSREIRVQRRARPVVKLTRRIGYSRLVLC